MTPLRRAAVRIAGFVVRHASSGCREWADGVAREVEFVEGDWAALGWALGSLRVLADWSEAPVRSLDEAEEKARQFAMVVPDRLKLEVGVSFLFAFGCLSGLILKRGSLVRSEVFYLVIVVASLRGILLLAQFRRSTRLPETDDVRDWARYYKDCLRQQCDFGSTGPALSALKAICVCLLSSVYFDGVGANPWISVSILVYASFLMLLLGVMEMRRRRSILRQISELEGLLKGGQR